MIFTDEMINNIPTITEEEERNDYWDAEEFINEGLAKFDKAISEIDKLYESKHQLVQVTGTCHSRYAPKVHNFPAQGETLGNQVA